jgi:hypothetical protein
MNDDTMADADVVIQHGVGMDRDVMKSRYTAAPAGDGMPA